MLLARLALEIQVDWSFQWAGGEELRKTGSDRAGTASPTCPWISSAGGRSVHAPNQSSNP